MKQARPHPLRIGALAEACGLSRDTIRHYERIGLLPAPPRTAGGFREYPIEAVRRVKVVQRALAIGFTLAELSGIFQERASGRAPCRRVRSLAGDKLRQLDLAIGDLRTLRDSLGRTLAAWDARLARTGLGQAAELLDSLLALPAPTSSVAARRGPPRRVRAG